MDLPQIEGYLTAKDACGLTLRGQEKRMAEFLHEELPSVFAAIRLETDYGSTSATVTTSYAEQLTEVMQLLGFRTSGEIDPSSVCDVTINWAKPLPSIDFTIPYMQFAVPAEK